MPYPYASYGPGRVSEFENLVYDSSHLPQYPEDERVALKQENARQEVVSVEGPCMTFGKIQDQWVEN
jgi:hypothetical protein